MLLSFFIATFLTTIMSLAESYKCRLYSPVYENEQKRGQNKLTETNFIDAYVQKQRQSQLLQTKKLVLIFNLQ